LIQCIITKFIIIHLTVKGSIKKKEYVLGLSLKYRPPPESEHRLFHLQKGTILIDLLNHPHISYTMLYLSKENSVRLYYNLFYSDTESDTDDDVDTDSDNNGDGNDDDDDNLVDDYPPPSPYLDEQQPLIQSRNDLIQIEVRDKTDPSTHNKGLETPSCTHVRIWIRSENQRKNVPKKNVLTNKKVTFNEPHQINKFDQHKEADQLSVLKDWNTYHEQCRRSMLVCTNDLKKNC